MIATPTTPPTTPPAIAPVCEPEELVDPSGSGSDVGVAVTDADVKPPVVDVATIPGPVKIGLIAIKQDTNLTTVCW